MISISNAQADEIIAVTDALRRMAFPLKDKNSCNAKRRANLIIDYLNKKKNGKKKRIIHTTR